mgnify:CR=1 FL=1
MKAYCCKERDGDGYAVIVYGKTRGQAKREGASELDIDFLDANVFGRPSEFMPKNKNYWVRV